MPQFRYLNSANQYEWYDTNTAQGEVVWIALTPPLRDQSVLGVAAAQTFYQQINDYNFNTGECGIGAFCNSFTQMMWASSTQAGYGIVQDCSTGSMLCTTYVVIRFSPKGSFLQ